MKDELRVSEQQNEMKEKFKIHEQIIDFKSYVFLLRSIRNTGIGKDLLFFEKQNEMKKRNGNKENIHFKVYQKHGNSEGLVKFRKKKRRDEKEREKVTNRTFILRSIRNLGSSEGLVKCRETRRDEEEQERLTNRTFILK